MERKRKMSIMVRLLLMVIPPCLLLGIAMTLYSGWNMHRGMQKTTLDGMRATDYAVLEMCLSEERAKILMPLSKASQAPYFLWH